jgi:hypothetical protein
VIFLQRAGMFVYLVLALILLFPLSSDPLRTVPPERLGLWHLTRRERMALRAAALVMNPLSWIMAILLFIGLRQHFDWTLAAVLGGMLALSLFVPPISGSVFDILRRCVPAFGGWFGFLVAKDLRQMLSVLDVYCALVLSATGFAFRSMDRSAPPEAMLAISILIVLALSSYAQSLFGLDGAAIARCRLMPLRGWQVLASKDAAFLIVAALLTAPLAPVAGISAAFVALAIGHAPTVYELREQRRGRFSTGASFGNGIVQAIAMAFAAGATFRVSVLFVLPCAVAGVVSLWWYGRVIDLRWREELSA